MRQQALVFAIVMCAISAGCPGRAPVTTSTDGTPTDRVVTLPSGATLKVVAEWIVTPVADGVQHPVLLIHGARDTRVNVRESEQMAEALRRAGKDVRLIVFPDEGHRRDYGNWRNALRHYREIEDFLASCLGGSRP